MMAVYRVEPFAVLRATVVDMVPSRVTSYSCHLYVTCATHKLPRIRRNLAATPSMENPIKVGIAAENKCTLIDRRVSIAPMMDWTDEVYSGLNIKSLQLREKAWHLYGTSEFDVAAVMLPRQHAAAR